VKDRKSFRNDGPHDRKTSADYTEGELEDRIYIRRDFAVGYVEELDSGGDIDDAEDGNDADTVGGTR